MQIVEVSFRSLTLSFPVHDGCPAKPASKGFCPTFFARPLARAERLKYVVVADRYLALRSSIFFFLDLCKLAKPFYEMVLEKATEIRIKSNRILRLSHGSAWLQT